MADASLRTAESLRVASAPFAVRCHAAITKCHRLDRHNTASAFGRTLYRLCSRRDRLSKWQFGRAYLESEDGGVSIRIAVLLALVISYPAQAADHSGPWPRFRGPNGSGVAADQQPPIEVGPEKNVRWKVPVPEGLSSRVCGEQVVLCQNLDFGVSVTDSTRDFFHEQFIASD